MEDRQKPLPSACVKGIAAMKSQTEFVGKRCKLIGFRKDNDKANGQANVRSKGKVKRRQAMYHHVKKLMYTVNVGTPDPRFGNMLLEQFGGANGELAAAMQYSVQGINCDDPGCKDLLMDIGTEELSHLEVIGSLARLHLETDETVAQCGRG